MNRRDLAKFLDSPQAIREYEASLANYTFTDLDEGYDNPDPDAPLAGTTTPTVPTPVPLSAELGIALTCDRQTNLTNFDRYEWQVSDDAGVTAYALGFSGTGLGVLDADTDVAVEFLVHRPLPLDVTGGAGVPVAKTWHYRVRRVTKLEVASAWSSWISGQSLTVGSGSLAEDSVYATQIIAAELQAMFARISYALTIGFGGTGSEDTPDDGDRRTYIDEDDFKQQIANAAGNWEDRISFGRRAGSNLFDSFVSGFSRVGDAALSSLGRIWKEGTNNFASTISGMVFSNGTIIAASQGDEIELSTDGGKTFGADVANNHTAGINGLVKGGSTVIAYGGVGELSLSTNDGTTWGALIANPFVTSSDSIRGMAYDTVNEIFVAVGTNTATAMYSDDGGVTWTLASTKPAGVAFNDVVFVGNATFIATDSTDGEVYVSTDSGDVWVQVVVSGDSLFGEGMAYGNGVAVVIFGDHVGGRRIYYSVDAGSTWTLSLSGTDTAISDVITYAEGVFYASTYISIDAGRSFTLTGYSDQSVSPPAIFTALAYDTDKDILAAGSTAGETYYSKWLEAGAGIVEQGSNPDGEYWIFGNRLQICMGALSVGAGATSVVNVAVGTHGWSFAHDSGTITLPKAFADTSYRVVPSCTVGNMTSTPVSKTTTTFDYGIQQATAVAGGAAYIIEYIAIGPAA